MQKLVFMITITKRSRSEEILSFLNKHNVPMTLGRFGSGTASDDMLNYLNIGNKEKCVTFSTLLANKARSILSELEKEMNLKTIGEGIAFTIPITSVAGISSLDILGGNAENEIEEVISMENSKNDLIVAIINRGYADFVMEAARQGGASGGTVVHARGTANQNNEKFFGSNVGAEKEIIFILSEKEKKQEIMKTIMEKAGNSSPAQTAVFSLPVLDASGIL